MLRLVGGIIVAFMAYALFALGHSLGWHAAVKVLLKSP